jgi:hypothetical protein
LHDQKVSNFVGFVRSLARQFEHVKNNFNLVRLVVLFSLV